MKTKWTVRLLKVFTLRLDCKLMKGNKNQISQHSGTGTSIAVKINTNHNSIKATVIMLGSTAVSSSWRSPVIAIKQASEVTPVALRKIK